MGKCTLLDEWESKRRKKEAELKEKKEKEKEMVEEEKEDTCVYDDYKEVEDVSDDVFSDDDDEDYRTYLKFVIKTEGFYVPCAPENGIGVAIPIGPSNSFWPVVEDGAELAVNHYNKYRAGPDDQLKLSCIQNVNSRSNRDLLFYITLEAKNVKTGTTDDYQAKVVKPLNKSLEVLMFRKKPKIVAEMIERHKAGLL